MLSIRTTSAALLLTAAAFVPAVAPSAASAAPNCSVKAKSSFLGLGGGDSLLAPLQADCILSMQARAGTGVLRQGMNWADIERTHGVYDFRYYDHWVAQVASHRMRILPVLSAPPAFRNKVAGPYMSPPRSNAAYARFVTAVAQRYGSHGSFWTQNPGVPRIPIKSYQIWNEPNLPQYWGGKPNARQYVALLKVASKALNRVDKRAEVVTAGMPQSLIHGAIPVSKFLPKLYKAHASRYFDTLAVNPYATNARGVMKALKATRRTMRRYHDRKAHLWVTEVGWGTGGPKHRFNIGTKAQAKQLKALVKSLYKARRSLRLRGLVYYGWEDRAPYAPDYKDAWGLHTGLLSANGHPKLAYRVLAKVVKRLHL